MTGLTVLDIVIGLIFVYLLYSLLATILLEIIATNFSLRAKMLEKAVIRMLEDNIPVTSQSQSLSKEFYNHPFIKFLGKNKWRPKPSYIDCSTFSKVIIDLLRGKDVKPGDDQKQLIQTALNNGTTNWSNNATKIGGETLLFFKSLWTDAQGDIEKFRELLENWFNETMERVTGWYKKHTQLILFFIGLFLAMLFNVDTLQIVEKLKNDPKLREQIVQQADAFVKAHPNLDVELQNEKADIEKYLFPTLNDTTPKDSIDRMKARKGKLDSLSWVNYKILKQKRNELLARSDSLLKQDIGKVNGLLGSGSEGYCKCSEWSCIFKMIFGWLLTALALSLGAPFWFDLLNKLMKLRNSIASSSSAEKLNPNNSEVQKIKRQG